MSKIIEIKSGIDLEASRLAEEVSEEEDFSTTLLNASLDGILTYNVNCVYTLWNPIMEEITGMKSSDVLGRNAFELFPFLNNPDSRKQYEVSLSGQSIRSPVLQYTVPATGNTGYIQQFNFPLFDEEKKVIGGLAIVREVTAIKNRFDKLHAQHRELENRIRELESELEKRVREKS